MSKTILKKNQVGEIMIIYSKIYCESTAIGLSIFTERQIVHWCGIETVEIQLHLCGRLIFNKGANEIQFNKWC